MRGRDDCCSRMRRQPAYGAKWGPDRKPIFISCRFAWLRYKTREVGLCEYIRTAVVAHLPFDLVTLGLHPTMLSYYYFAAILAACFASFLASTVQSLPVTAFERQAPSDSSRFGYLSANFYKNDEQVFFQLSDGDDPLSFSPVNNNKPVLVNDQGSKGEHHVNVHEAAKLEIDGSVHFDQLYVTRSLHGTPSTTNTGLSATTKASSP